MGISSGITTICCCSGTSISKLHFHHHLPRASIPSISPSPSPALQGRIKFSSFSSRSVAAARHRLGSATASSVGSSCFTWDDVFRAGESNETDSASDLGGFFDRVILCNRNLEKLNEFMPFVIANQIVGYVHFGFADHLRKFRDVFVFQKDTKAFSSNFGCHVTLHSSLTTAEDRTRAVGDVVKCLGEELIPGIRNELFPVVSSFGSPIFFSVERAAAPYFGTKPHGISCEKNLVKECEEEAGIPSSISGRAVPVGAISYMDIDGHRFKRDVMFCYDLKLPEGFIPRNEDGEVESFKLVPVTHVANIIRSTEFYKANCNLVIIDFLFRHGYITPENIGYLKLLQSLRSGDCS
ncbi:nudix hydrolase 20, chloroplastic-like isoform X3 [Coffea arabica]|uniref:Nudix hydrolase 20, chloroplastic-like isoform X3 n=1 Tax=Coffea arabica TaxID=13443 RepID=A0A6P6SYC6_COFAR